MNLAKRVGSAQARCFPRINGVTLPGVGGAKSQLFWEAGTVRGPLILDCNSKCRLTPRHCTCDCVRAGQYLVYTQLEQLSTPAGSATSLGSESIHDVFRTSKPAWSGGHGQYVLCWERTGKSSLGRM